MIMKLKRKCIFYFASFMRVIAPKYCIRHFTVKKWKSGKKNIYARWFLPYEEEQFKMSQKLSKDELLARVWDYKVICFMLIQFDLKITADELIELCASTYNESPYEVFEYARRVVDAVSSERKRSVDSLFRYTNEEGTWRKIAIRRQIAMVAEYLEPFGITCNSGLEAKLVKAVLPLLEDKRLVPENDYEWWIIRACMYLPWLEEFLEQNEVCKENLATNARWQLLKEALEKFKNLKELKVEDAIEQVCEGDKGKARMFLDAVFTEALWDDHRNFANFAWDTPFIALHILTNGKVKPYYWNSLGHSSGMCFDA